MLIDIRPRIFKPTFDSAEIDWRHPLARGLRDCWILNEGAGNRLMNLARPVDATASSGSFVWSVRRSGFGIDPAGGSNQASYGSTTYAIPNSFVIEVIFQASPNYVVWGGSGVYSIYVDGTNFNAADGTDNGSVAHNGITTGQTYQITHVRGPGANNARYYKNAIDLGTASMPNNASYVLSTLGALAAGTFRLDGKILRAFSYSRMLSQSEVTWLLAEPHAFLRPKPSVRFWSTPTAGAAASVVTPRSLALLGVGS